MHKLKIRNIGNSLGVVLPKELLDRNGLRVGDELALSEKQVGFSLDPVDEVLSDAEEWIARGAEKYRKTLQALSK
ncbi:MAG: AbrB/MazE/SpoVT family DNA-binding domain-containing protein [Pseudomonadota bacterium]